MRALVGRSAEVATVLPVLRRAAQRGQSATVLVTGDAGIGKSAFLAEVVRQATRMGFAAGTGKADEIGQIAVGAPLLLALRSGRAPLLDEDDFARICEVSDEPLRLIDRVALALEARSARQPVLVAVDDYQWADHVTRVALRVLADRLVGLPVIWLVASRGPADVMAADLAAPAGDRTAVCTVRLGPLTDADIGTIASEALGKAVDAGIRDRLHGAGGNPLIALQFLAADGDRSLRRAVRDRLGALSPLARAVVQTVVVWGRPMAIGDLAALFPDQTIETLWPAVSEAHAAELMSEPAGEVSIRHDLVREEIYRDLPEPVRCRLHRRCAERLLADARDVLEAVPHVRACAGRGDLWAVDVLRRAALSSLATVPDVAVEMIGEAFARLDAGHPGWAEVGRDYADVLAVAQRGAEAVAVVDLLLAHSLDQEIRAGLQVTAARALWLGGALEEIVQRVDAALTQAPMAAVQQVRLRAFRALAETRLGAAAEVAVAADQVLADAQRLADPTSEQIARQALGEIARNQQRHGAALAQFRTLRISAGATYLGYETAALRLLDRFDEADLLIRAAGDGPDGERFAQSPAVLESRMWQGFMVGHFDEARAEAVTLARLSQDLRVPIFELETAMVRTLVAVITGDLAEARRRLRAAERDVRTDDIVRTPRLKLLRSLLAGLDGDPAAGVAMVEPVMDLAAESQRYWPRLPEWMRVHAGLATAAGHAGFARDSVARAENAARTNPGVASLEGIALQVRGWVERDADRLAAAVDRLERSPRPFLLASALADQGAVLRARGDHRAARPLLERAWSIYHRIGAVLPGRAVDAELRAAGFPSLSPPDGPRPVTGWESLTNAERRVAALISDGHTNQTAARELGISTNTLATHLRSVFPKLGVRSRVQLANTWRAHHDG